MSVTFLTNEDGDCLTNKLKGIYVDTNISLGTISQGGFGLNNIIFSSTQVCRTELLEVNINGEVFVTDLPDNIKYKIYYGDSPTYSESNTFKEVTSDYVSDSSFGIVAKYIRVKLVAYDDNGNRINITPNMCEGIKFSTRKFEGAKTQYKKDKIIRVVSNTATTEEKAYADYLCDGINDQVEINQALQDIANMNGGKLQLSSGVFYIDNFALDDDGVYRGISVPAITGLTVTIQGMGGMSDGNIIGTCIDLSKSAYDALPTETTDQRELFGQAFTSTLSSTVLYLSDIRFRTPGNKKPLIFIDLYNFGRVTLEHVYGYAYKGVLGSGLNPAVEGLIGVRMLRGSNFGAENTYKSCGMNGFYEGWQVGSEHVYMRQCSAIYNVYGYTFGNYTWSNSFLHPITMIRCTDERNLNLPLFKACGFYESSNPDHHQGQRIDMIDFSIERKEDGTPGHTLYDLAIEETPGSFNGDIVFTMTDHKNLNCYDIPFFQSGGSNFKVRNSYHKLIGTTETRLTYAATNMQQYFDTDLNKMLFYINEKWIDANGVEVDSTTK